MPTDNHKPRKRGVTKLFDMRFSSLDTAAPLTLDASRARV